MKRERCRGSLGKAVSEGEGLSLLGTQMGRGLVTLEIYWKLKEYATALTLHPVPSPTVEGSHKHPPFIPAHDTLKDFPQYPKRNDPNTHTKLGPA